MRPRLPPNVPSLASSLSLLANSLSSPVTNTPTRPDSFPAHSQLAHLMVSQERQEPGLPSSSSAMRAAASMDASPAPPLLLRAPTPSIDLPAGKDRADAAASKAAAVFELRREPKIPAPFLWPHEEARPTSAAELEVPVVDVGVLRNGDRAGLRRAAAQVAAACATHGFFQVCGHGVDAALGHGALDGASDFFRLPLAEKHARAR